MNLQHRSSERVGVAAPTLSFFMPLPKVLPQVGNARRGPDGAAVTEGRAPSGKPGLAGGAVGKVVANRYSMERKLGSGAFGTAFLVLDRRANSDK